ncbi:MAG: alkane 1-monooxygenase [Parvularculaceae bacterium]
MTTADVDPSSRLSAPNRGAGAERRWIWLLSFGPMVVAPMTIALYAVSGGAAVAAFFPLAFIYVLLPIIDVVVGEDARNPSPATLEAMARRPYYDWLLYGASAALLASIASTIAFVGLVDLPAWAAIAFALGSGQLHGQAMNVGHELGHRPRAVDRAVGQFTTGLVGYGHFCIEHNRGHHVAVATPGDPASARLGESVYAFAARELPAVLRKGWAHEAARLTRKGRPVVSVHNQILQSYAVAAFIAAVSVAVFGWWILGFLALHNFAAWFALTLANYVEHYGLLRQRRADGRYEPTAPRHSWNSNHLFSNLLLFQLQRHSDHHAHPARPYQALRHHDEAPQLPSGYPGAFALAVLPPLWFRVMDPKVLAWADGDLGRVNVHPPARARLQRRYA